jgi:hypothetical protein
MPIVFIHGVNVRSEDKSYERERKRRQKLMRDIVLSPLRSLGGRFKGIEMHDIYWGDLGVKFAWNLASMPKAKFLDSFGPDEEDTSTNLLLEQAIDLVDRENAGKSDQHQNLDSTLKRAAAKDPVRFAETLLLPLLLSDFQLSDEDSTIEGELQALVAEAVRDAASDPVVQEKMITANSDSELIEVLRAGVERRLRVLVESSSTDSPAIESYGFSDQIGPRIRELFGRALHLPTRIVSAPTMRVVRPGFNRTVSRFFGDVFVYLQNRGTPGNPGPIVQRVLSELKAASRARADEPMIVLTHSMGGNILYDVLTSFSSDLHIDVWISVGGQVAQFEEMKLFIASDPAVKTPARVTGIKSRVGYWLNVYDPIDPFSYMARPVFGDVDADLPFSTGGSLLKSHGEYFGRASFHGLLKEHIEKGLGLQ